MKEPYWNDTTFDLDADDTQDLGSADLPPSPPPPYEAAKWRAGDPEE
jgi:hypothetical protein